MLNEKSPNGPELPPGPRKEKERPPLEIEGEISRPWEEMEREEEESLIARYSEKAELSAETQRYLNETLRGEAEERNIDFAKKWFKEHREDLEDKGISSDISEERKAAIAIEKGALRDLKTKEEYKEKYEEIENLNALRIDLGKKHLPVESQFLTLNVLDKKAGRIEKQILKMRSEGKSDAETAIKERELEGLFKARKELAEKASGRNLEEEARKDAQENIIPKDRHVDKGLTGRILEIEDDKKKEIFKGDWDKLDDSKKAKYGDDPLPYAEERISKLVRNIGGIDLSRRDVLFLLSAGYNPAEFKEKGILGKKIEVKKGQKMLPGKFEDLVFGLRARLEGFGKEVTEKAKKSLVEEWEKEYQRLVREEMERKMIDLAFSPEKAAEGIEGMYLKVKDRLIAEWLEKDLKKEPKKLEELRVIKKEFGKKGKNPVEFLAGARSLQQELSGDLDGDSEEILGFLSGYGVDASRDYLASRIGPEAYGKAARRERGFLEWLLNLVYESFETASGAKVGKKKETSKRR